ncbi:AbiU2 domain-containing protein [Luteimonas sp. A537]
MLHVSRLTGPTKSMGKENLTVRRIPDLVQDFGLRNEIQNLVDSCQAHCTFVSDHRNKRLAHYDLETAVQNLEANLTGVSRLQLRLAVESLQEIVQKIYAHYANTHFDFDTSLRTDNAESLLRALAAAESKGVAR